MSRHLKLVVSMFFIGWAIVWTYGCQPQSANTIPAAFFIDTDEEAPAPQPFHSNALDNAIHFCEAAQKHWEKGKPESALKALDRAYVAILSVEGDSAALAQQKEDLRFLISKRILEIYASRKVSAAGHHKAIPRSMNTNVKNEINKLTGPEKQFFINAYRRSGQYRPMIVQKLKAAGLPTELSWLPLIESGFRAEALSPARALGLWQFIPSTGYKFGLKRDAYRDERMDFEKSTDAAIDYLRELHGIFGDWSTVLAAYNCGEGRVLNLIRAQNINYLDDFWDLYSRLPYETARYVPRFLATVHIIENAKQYGLSEITPDAPLDFETVTVQRSIHLKDLAPLLNVPVSVLETLNPELRYQILPPTAYPLRVPVGKNALATTAIQTIPICALPAPPSPPPSSSPKPSFAYHTVKKGETLSGIATRYKTSVNQLTALNQLKKNGRIVIGQTLKIPRASVTAAAPPPPQKNAPRAWTRQHVVKSGDSLWNIATRYNTTPSELQKANNLSRTAINIGQTLKVPTPAGRQEKQTAPVKTYTVKKGETASLIARKNKIPLDRFLKMNHLTLKSTIHPGQIVRIN